MQDFDIPIDLILLQETWEVKFPEQFSLPGFQNIVYRTREGGRGGGVGIYVRNGLNFKIRTDLECYKLKTFENIVLEIQYHNKHVLISNIYRSPNPPPLTSVSEHMDNFIETLDYHLSNISDCNCPAYIFTDSNINLFNLQTNPICTNYIDTMIINGFVQIISKATRVQNNKKSLIDHIITKLIIQFTMQAQ
jgi:exonuclease III